MHSILTSRSVRCRSTGCLPARDPSTQLLTKTSRLPVPQVLASTFQERWFQPFWLPPSGANTKPEIGRIEHQAQIDDQGIRPPSGPFLTSLTIGLEYGW